MSIFEKHKVWWNVIYLISFLMSLIDGLITQQNSNLLFMISYIVGSFLGIIIFSFIIAGIPWLFFLIIKRKLASKKFMIIYSVAFGLTILSRIVFLLNLNF